MGDILTYESEIKKAMDMLGKEKNTIFIGQQIIYSGSIMSKSLIDISSSKKIELPIMEDCQMGMSIGLSLEGYLPVSIYPRMDFLILAMNQMVNHLDKIASMSRGRFEPKVIVRTAIGSTKPLYPGLQHCSDYTDGLQRMLKNVSVKKIWYANQVMGFYRDALKSENSTILIEVADSYAD